MTNSNSKTAGKTIPLFLILIATCCILTRGQTQPTVDVSPTEKSVDSDAPPVPLAEVVTQSEKVATALTSIEQDLASDQLVSTVENELPILKNEIDARQTEQTKTLNARPSLETLRTLERQWHTMADAVDEWKNALAVRGTDIQHELAQIAQLNATWSQTRERTGHLATGAEAVGDQNDASEPVAVPPQTLQRIEAVIARINDTKKRLEDRSARILALQNQVADQGARIEESIAQIEQMRAQTIDHLFVRDSPAIWSEQLRADGSGTLLLAATNSFTTQWAALRSYATRQWHRLIIHAVIVALLITALYWARRRVQPWLAAEPALASVAQVFKIPIATAFVLSILLSNWIYPQAPQMLGALLGAGALIPAMIVLRQLIKRSLFPILNALVVFYFVDQLRAIATALPLLSRLLFVAELAGGIVCFALLLRSAKLTEASLKEGSHFRRLVRIWAGAGIALFVIAFVANAIGSVSLSNLLGNAFLNSAYLAVILYASIRIADGLLMLALRVRPLSLLGMVHQHRPLFRRRIQRLVRWLASSAWILFALEQLSLRKTVVEGIRALLTAKFGIGSLQISLGHVAAFVITVWLAFLFSRFLRFMLEEDVYPRVNLARGIPYAVSTTLHYVILLLGFFIAIAALGIDMTKFTILAGAFGVGLGFGMQTIVNNFVSGLILLFERPVKVGDVVQLGEHAGDLRRIGLRASVLRTWEGSEVIVPNGALISDEVVNWTLSDQQRRIEVNVGVAYGTDPELVIDLLTKVAELHDEILKDPAPQTLFKDFGDSALNFQLRAWTANFQRWMLIKSELTVGVNAALRDAGISIPFPQRDLHLQTIAPELSKSLSGRNGAVGAVDPNRR